MVLSRANVAERVTARAAANPVEPPVIIDSGPSVRAIAISDWLMDATIPGRVEHLALFVERGHADEYAEQIDRQLDMTPSEHALAQWMASYSGGGHRVRIAAPLCPYVAEALVADLRDLGFL